jgi:hypothetical protein
LPEAASGKRLAPLCMFGQKERKKDTKEKR